MKTPIALLCALLALAPAAEASPRQEILTGPLSGRVLNVMDGDTVSVRLHVWIGQELETSVRINGIDTPEMKGKCRKEREMAAAARAEVAGLIGDNPVSISNVRLEKYAGRVLADVRTADGTDIAHHLIGKGLARPYHGQKRGAWCS